MSHNNMKLVPNPKLVLRRPSDKIRYTIRFITYLRIIGCFKYNVYKKGIVD